MLLIHVLSGHGGGTFSNGSDHNTWGWGGGTPIMDYMGWLRPKGVPLSGWMYIKGKRFHKLKYRKNRENCHLRNYLKGAFKISRTDPTKKAI